MAIPNKNDNPINFNSLMINDDEFEVEEVDEGVKNIPNKTLSISKLKNKLKNSDKFKKRKSKSLNDFNIEKLKKDMIDSLLNSVDNNNKNYIDSCNSNKKDDNIGSINIIEQINKKDEKNNNIDIEINQNKNIDIEINENKNTDIEINPNIIVDNTIIQNNNFEIEINQNIIVDNDDVNQNNHIDNTINQNNYNNDNTINQNNINIKKELNCNNENINQEFNKEINSIKEETKQKDTISNKDNEITTENDENFLIYESELSDELICNLKSDLTKSIATSNPEFILIIDASKDMENYIDPLINNLCYNSLKKLGYNDKEKIHLFCFNSEDIDERHIQLNRLLKIKILAEGEREIGELFDYFLNTIFSKKGKNFRILFFFSGSVIWNFELFNSLKLFTINQDYNEIDCHIVKYIINDKTNFNEQDDILFNFLKHFSFKTNDICILNAKNNNDNINTIYKLFQN